jgi:hypothetical protein
LKAVLFSRIGIYGKPVESQSANLHNDRSSGGTDTLQLPVVNPLHGGGKQVFHPYSHTTLPHIACIVTSLGIVGNIPHLS